LTTNFLQFFRYFIQIHRFSNNLLHWWNSWSVGQGMESKVKDSSWSLKISREKKSISNLCIHSKDCQWYHRRKLPNLEEGSSQEALYRVSHLKLYEVIWLCWPHLCMIHQFVSFFMLCTLYRMICINSKYFFCKNSLNVKNVKPLSFFFQHYWPFYASLVRMTTCTLHIKWFPWHQEPE
jgi:hypothetical protein